MVRGPTIRVGVNRSKPTCGVVRWLLHGRWLLLHTPSTHSFYTHTHTYIYTHMHTHTHTCSYTYAHSTHIHAYTHTYLPHTPHTPPPPQKSDIPPKTFGPRLTHSLNSRFAHSLSPIPGIPLVSPQPPQDDGHGPFRACERGAFGAGDATHRKKLGVALWPRYWPPLFGGHVRDYHHRDSVRVTARQLRRWRPRAGLRRPFARVVRRRAKPREAARSREIEATRREANTLFCTTAAPTCA
jgi:hypothetical protein